MSMLFKSLSGLETILASAIPAGHRLTVLSGDDMFNVAWGDMRTFITANLEARVAALEEGGGGGGGQGAPSIWPAARTLSLTGIVSGSVAMDGSMDVSLATSIADNAIPIVKVNGLDTRLTTLETSSGNKWGTGFTIGPQPSSFGGNLDALQGAVFLQTQSGTTNTPTGGAADWLILQNGSANNGQQIALKAGEMQFRSQVAGTWGSWRRNWHSGNLDITTLMLKTDVANSALQLANSRSFKLDGVITSNAVNFNGTGNVTLTTVLADNALSISQVAGLQTALDNRITLRGTYTGSLNNIASTGIYNQNVAADATLANGYPVVGVIGILHHYTQGGVSTQRFETETGLTYHRYSSTQLGSWTAWRRNWTHNEFDPTTKFDKTGGTISGNVWVTGFVSGQQINSTSVTIDQLTPTTEGTWSALIYDSTIVGANSTGGIWNGVGEVSFVNARNGGWHNLTITDDGVLRFKTQQVFHTGNFNPEAPVPGSGVLYIGPTGGTHLRFRADGRYSTDSGTTWRVLNETPAVNTDPELNSIKIGASKNIYLYTDTGEPDSLQVRTGSAGTGYRWFQFKDNGNFQVPNGRILIGGYEAWHAGNFDPATRLGVNANAASATKLATARTINGVAFDGTASITIPTSIQTSSISDLTVRVPTGMYETAPEGTTVEKGFPAGVVGGWAFTESVTHTNTSNYFATQRVTSFNDIGHSYIRAVTNVGTGPWYRQWNGVNLPNPMSRNGGDMLGALMSYQNGYFTPAIDAPLITKSFDAFTSGRYNGIGRWGVFMEAGRIGFGVPQGANGPKVFEYAADGTIAREHLFFTSGNLTPLDVNNGGTVRNIVHFKYGAPNTQKTFHTFGWNNEINRFAHVMEGGGEFVLYSYDANGSTPRQACIWRSYDVTNEAGRYRTLDNFGGIRTSGPYATFVIEDRGDPNVEWHHYSVGGQYRIWSKQGNADRLSINPDGYTTVHGRLSASGVFSGWDSGVAGSISCSNWFRTTGATGIFFADYGGGVYMDDTTFVKAYNGKAFAASAFQNTGGSPSPDVNAQSAAFKAVGNWGGGFAVIDPTVAGAFYGGGGQLKIAIANSGPEGYLYGLTYGKDGVLTANDYALYSDRRLKKNIKPLEFRGPLVPVEHEWRPGKGEAGIHLGFIAQTMKKLYPELVRNVSEGELTVIYPKVTAVLAAQNNHQQKLIDKQQKTISAQEKFLKVLKGQVASQQKQINKIMKQLKAA